MLQDVVAYVTHIMLVSQTTEHQHSSAPCSIWERVWLQQHTYTPSLLLQPSFDLYGHELRPSPPRYQLLQL